MSNDGFYLVLIHLGYIWKTKPCAKFKLSSVKRYRNMAILQQLRFCNNMQIVTWNHIEVITVRFIQAGQ